MSILQPDHLLTYNHHIQGDQNICTDKNPENLVHILHIWTDHLQVQVLNE